MQETTRTFYDNAMLAVVHGIPIIPCLSRNKSCVLENWPSLATTDQEQLRRWNAENPEYNVGYVAKLELGAPCFLEFDVAKGMTLAAQEMGQAVPETRMDRSGKGFGHWIFSHTNRSLELGNRQARNRESGGEWFSFRADRRYIIGAGSIHPNGNTYKLVKDIKPQPIPDWICDFIAKYTISGPTKSVGSYPIVSEDFDFDDMMSFFEISGYWDGYWFVVDQCPVAGRKHTHSTRTGFYFDGEVLGWHDFAQGCEGSEMSIGALLACLNQNKGERYQGEIWPEREIDLNNPKWDIEVLEPQAEEPKTTEEAPGQNKPGLEPAPPVAMPQAKEATPVDDYADQVEEFDFDHPPVALEFPKVEPKNDGLAPRIRIP